MKYAKSKSFHCTHATREHAIGENGSQRYPTTTTTFEHVRFRARFSLSLRLRLENKFCIKDRPRLGEAQTKFGLCARLAPSFHRRIALPATFGILFPANNNRQLGRSRTLEGPCGKSKCRTRQSQTDTGQASPGRCDHYPLLFHRLPLPVLQSPQRGSSPYPCVGKQGITPSRGLRCHHRRTCCRYSRTRYSIPFCPANRRTKPCRYQWIGIRMRHRCPSGLPRCRRPDLGHRRFGIGHHPSQSKQILAG